MWLRWRGRGAAAELAEQRLLGPHWREVGDPGAPTDGALLEDGAQVHTSGSSAGAGFRFIFRVHPTPAALVPCSLRLLGSEGGT